MALRARKVSGAFEKQALGLKPGLVNEYVTVPPTLVACQVVKTFSTTCPRMVLYMHGYS